MKKVAILDIDDKTGEQLSEKLNRSYTNKVVFIKCDVSKENDVQTAYEQSLKTLGLIDVIINNAGGMDDSPNVWRTASDVNWQDLVSFTMKGVSHMGKDEGGAGGTIINVSSVVALISMPILPIYSGSEAAVIQFGRSMAIS
ncbi:15-hydroxyprostaglandin dehydrogenase [Danaus plexippus plexippus]|uniref:15-hydroxyprostaglandin dehydrogenase n=1 Tax=Danaus plexippus plexippus TaxID=278856 RepID=A0A212EUD2_DANPL|nr:15-hydroxyprostaglandin dehydrogenase [Danaus plexippus plexippus]